MQGKVQLRRCELGQHVVEDGWIEMNERVRFPARPMVGVVGVATGGDELTTGLAGVHGGNLDNHLHGPGARILFPVRQPGGMFAVGDMHASMGDGEICGTGVEMRAISAIGLTVESTLEACATASSFGPRASTSSSESRSSSPSSPTAT